MMRSLFFVVATLAVMGLGYWAYHENYKTQAALDDVDAVSRDIAELHARKAVLSAEWAYLNRPDRLRELVIMNYENLQLLPLTSDQFGRVDQIAYPEDDTPLVLPNGPSIDVQGVISDITDVESAQ